jgi:Trk K+ transport system NAD-binding subunit
VVVGAGRLGRLFLEALREKDPLRQVLVVDRDVEKADIREMLRRFRASFYPGDIRERGCFDSLGLDRARAVVLITEDDVVNLEAAWRLAEIAPHLVITAHVGDLAMWRTVRSLQDRGGARIHIFNGHRIAARQLYQDHLHDYFESTHPRDVVVIVGFGRFGQTLLEYLQAAAGSQIQRAVIVDLAARRQLRVYRRHVPYSDRFGLVAIEGDTDDPEIWERIEEAVAGVGVDPVYILGTDDDRLNLRAAMVFRREHPQARIFVRAVYESAFTNTVSRQLRFEMLSVESMLRVALAEEQEKWGPAPRPSILPMPAE